MDDEFEASTIPFGRGEWILDRHNPGQPGQYTGRHRMAGPHMMLQLQFPTGETTFRPLDCLEPIAKASANTLTERLVKGLFGRARDLQRLVTYEKLKGTQPTYVRWMSRLSVAYGLSFDKADLSTFTYPKNLDAPETEDIRIINPPDSRSPHIRIHGILSNIRKQYMVLDPTDSVIANQTIPCTFRNFSKESLFRDSL